MPDNPLYDATECGNCGNGNIWYACNIDGETILWCPNEDCENHRLYRREDVLRELWVNQGYTQDKVAKRLHTSVRTVQRWINRHGIEKTSHLETKFVNGYHILRHKDGEANRKVRIHRLVATMEHGLDSVKGMEVHHKNGVRWDNRPSNLELLEPEQHGRVSNKQRYDRMKL